MARIRRIDDERSAAALADLLNGGSRRLPVVVVTIPASRTEPWIDVEEVAQEAGDLAEVYLMPTGQFTWEFSRRMAEGTQVYGGAARVYPVGHEWASDLASSPLRFAFGEEDGQRATELLISDTLRMAAAAGMLRSRPTTQLRRAGGVVKSTVARRALIDVGNQLPAAIAEELTVEGVGIEHLVRVGQRVEGWYDAQTNRVDVSKDLQAPDDALASYSVGDVVLTKVATVRNGKAELVLYPKTAVPGVTVAVLRADVTTNPADDLRTLMTVGEVIPARVVSLAPHWALVLSDVDDDEPIVEAPALLVGGPPWLVEESITPEPEDEAPSSPVALAMPTPLLEPSPAEPEALEEPPPPPRPSPAMLDKNRAPRPAPAPPTVVPPHPSELTKSLLLKVDALTAEVASLQRGQEDLRTQLLAGTHEAQQLRYLLDQAERRSNRAEHDLKAARSRLRNAGKSKASTAGAAAGPRFADPERGFRYLVLTQWATRTLPAEQRDRPLEDYLLGPHFLESLERLEGIKEEKVADVVFEIVTGLAPMIQSRDVHRLRTGPGGDDPVRVRDDGAVAWRASLQVNTPSARRIHYWVLPNSPVELAKVATHDDFSI